MWWRKLISAISVVLALNLASKTYGIGIGDFENSMDGWSFYYPNDPNISTSFSATGATLNQNSLRIQAISGYRQAIAFNLIANNMVDEFRKNLKVSADITRLVSEWTVVGSEYCEFFLVVSAGSSAAGKEWDLWEQLTQNAGWALAGQIETVKFTYDYSLTLPQIDFDNLTYLQLVFCTNWGGYSPGGVYYLDNVQMFGGGAAYAPNPQDGGRDVPVKTALGWIPGVYADKHDVYFGTNFNDVNDASRTNDPNGVLASFNQDANSFDPGSLQVGQTYYWRVDEVNDIIIWKGDVWRFTTAYLEGGYVLGDWEDSMDGWFIWTRTRATSSYSTTGATLNNKSLRLDIPTGWDWVLQLNLNAEQLEALKANDLFALDVTWVNSEWQGHSWANVEGIAINSAGFNWAWQQITQPIGDTSNPAAPGQWNPSFTDDTRTITWDYSVIPVANIPAGAATQFIIATGHDATIGPGIFYFDNARFLKSGLASNPHPANRATGVRREPTLSWTPGRNTDTHDVYFGTNFNDVSDVNTVNLAGYPNVTFTNIDVNSFKPRTLEFSTTYYWRVDEVSVTQPDDLRKGHVWSFTTGNFLVVDDFEDYNDTSNRIFDTWVDYAVNNTGMTVGHLEPPFAERRIVHSDYQSMYMRYDNDGTVNEGTSYQQSGTLLYSQAQRQWTDPQDWTRQGVRSLALWFKGIPASVGSFRANPPIYIMTAAGADIWGTSDQFHFAYKRFSGVGSITAKVLSVSNTDPWAKAGVMIRETLAANATHVMVVVTPGSGVSLQNRSTTGGVSEEVTVAGVRAPQWVRLTRSGNTFTGEYSANGIVWKPVGSVTIPMLADVYIGLCLTSHNVNTMGTANFSNVTINGTAAGDWLSSDIGIESNIAEPMYVVLQDSAGNGTVVKHPDPAASAIGSWTEWSIPLTDFTGVNLQTVKKMIIGVGDRTNTAPGGSGTLYIDDIRLYLP